MSRLIYIFGFFTDYIGCFHWFIKLSTNIKLVGVTYYKNYLESLEYIHFPDKRNLV